MNPFRLIFISGILMFCALDMAGQSFAEGCDGFRYAYEVFPSFDKTTVKYATAIPENKDLYVDIYQPKDDNVSARPMIILAHGGAFISGNKSDMVSFCEFYVKQGFVVASIQYRLLVGFPTPEAITVAALKAISDMKGAYRFFKSDAANADLYKVDTTKMFIGGLSAGAITALHAAYLDENDQIDATIKDVILSGGGYSGNTGDAENLSHEDTDIFGVFNLSGALFSNKLLDYGEPMLMSYHGDKDDVVPIDSNSVFGLGQLYGSRAIHIEAELIGIPNTIVVVPGGLHTDVYTDPKYLSYLIDYGYKSTALYYPRLCGMTAASGSLNKEDLGSSVYPNPSRDNITFEFIKDVDKVWVLDQRGNIVLQSDVNGNTYRLTDHNLTNGSYFLVPIIKTTGYKALPFSIIR